MNNFVGIVGFLFRKNKKFYKILIFILYCIEKLIFGFLYIKDKIIKFVDENIGEIVYDLLDMI